MSYLIGLSVNACKFEFICFNSPYAVAPFVAGTAILTCSSLVNWLGLCFGPTLSSTFSSLVNQAVKNLRSAYGKISPSKSRYNGNGLCMIYNAHCAPVLLFLSGMAHLFRKKILIFYMRLISDIAKSSSGFLDGTKTEKYLLDLI